MSQVTGQIGEGIAEKYLLNKGYKLIARNERSKRGEVDLIMMDGETLVFCEVKTRVFSSDLSAFEAVTPKKRSALSKTAMTFIHNNRLYDHPARFDVVIITGKDEQAQIEHIPNAFDFIRGRYFV